MSHSRSSRPRDSVRPNHSKFPTDGNLHTLPTSPILLLPSVRPARKIWSNPSDPHPNTSYGDTIREKSRTSFRVFFQNVKGLSYNNSFDDYKYYFSSLRAYAVDISGLAETNTAWQHAHLRHDVRKVVHGQYRQSKLIFGSPDPSIDKCAPNEVYQSGGSMTMIQGPITSSVYGDSISDDTGLGRWSGITLRGSEEYKLTLITAYRTCDGNIRTSSIGSVFSREYLYFRSQGIQKPNPRRMFFRQLSAVINNLQALDHRILLMLDANSDLATDYAFAEFLSQCDLHDLHKNNPPPSTYIGSSHRRIDYILGCGKLITSRYRSGSLSYFEGPQSDHRGLFVDFEIPYLTSSLRVQPLTYASQRVLHTGNPELVSSYLKSVREYYSAHRMEDRINDLFSRHTTMDKSEVLSLLTSWDQDQGRAMSLAERKLSRPPKKCEWSPILRNTAIIRKYWKLRLREVTKSQSYYETFCRWQSDIQRRDPNFMLPFLNTTMTAEEIRKHFNVATKQFRRAQMDSTALRMKSYEELLTTYAEDVDPMTKNESERKAKVVLRTLKTEMCRKTFSDLRHVFKPSERSALSQILIPVNDALASSGSTSNLQEILRETPPEELRWDTIVDRTEMEKHLLEYNREAFRAAAESPCGHGLIYNAITFTSLSSAARDLLEGIVPPEWHGDDMALKEFLASFAMPEQVRCATPISIDISEVDVIHGFKRWRETTTTSPSGRHLGHYKALIQDSMLLRCLTKFLNIALFHGIAIPRWCNATNVLLEKDTGRPTINRLRIIHLFEADFNFLLKLLWGSRLVQRAVEFDLLNSGQFGSVPRKTTMDPIMLSQLTTDLSRILKMNMARFDNDASACYDRIIVSFGMLAARRCGMPESAISTHSSALQFMRYAVKMFYGVSIQQYFGTADDPLFGTGQGSGASPAVWLTLVVLLLNTLEKLTPERISFESPNSTMTHTRLVDAYVDDTSAGFTDPYSDFTLEDMIETLQRIAQSWEHILSLSGGSLNFKKCSWYVVYWEWKNGRPFTRPIGSEDPKIILCNSFGSPRPQEIPRMPLDTSLRVLGVQLSPSGSFSDHIQIYKNKADLFAARLHSPRIKAIDARIFHRSIYVPTMRYGLAALSASEEDLSTIQTRVLASLLQKMNVSSKLPTSIRHGPTELGGLGLYDLRTESGIESLKFLRNAVFSNSAAGQLILLNLQYLQLESGIGECLLEHPNKVIPYLTPSWLLSLREFLSKHNLSVTLTDQPSITTTGPMDQFIMQHEHLTRYTLCQQRDINLVRIYLQVNTLADMCDTAQSNRINLWYLDGKRPQDWSERMRWPRQASPSSSQRRLWKRYISSSYLRYVPFWKQPPVQRSQGILRSKFQETQSPTHDPRIGIKSTLSEYLRTLPRTQRRMVSEVEQVADDLQVWRAFRSRERLYIASDGGLDGTKGTFGWVLATSKRILFKCGGPVDGPFDTQNSTRCELCGFASSLLLIASLSRNWGLRHRCTFKWFTDSRAAISKVFKTNRRGCEACRQTYDSDLLSLIRGLLKEIRRIVTFNWVKGHQDSIKAYAQLPRPAQLNIDSDFLATRYRLRGRLKSTPQVDHCPEQRVSISIMGVRLTGQYDECIRHHINGYHLKQYMQDRKNWDDATWNCIDMGLFGQHFCRLTSSQQIPHMKIVHDQLPLGHRRFQQSQSQDEVLKQCPCCRDATEDSRHFLRCMQNPYMNDGLQALRRSSVGGSHPFRRILVSGIKHWIQTGESNFDIEFNEYPTHMHASLNRIISEQNRIGWDNAIKGFLSKSWIDLASVSYDSDKLSVAEGAQRLREGIKALHTFTKGLWKARNAALHDADEGQNQQLRSRMQDTIIHMHQHPNDICFEDRYLCNMPLSNLLTSSPSTQRRWIKRMRDSKLMQTRLGERQTLITSYFGPRSLS